MTINLGNNIKSLRTGMRISLERLSDMCYVSKTYICQLENNKIPNPNAALIKKISVALGVTADYLNS